MTRKLGFYSGSWGVIVVPKFLMAVRVPQTDLIVTWITLSIILYTTSTPDVKGVHLINRHHALEDAFHIRAVGVFHNMIVLTAEPFRPYNPLNPKS